jgi:hypothetical protein
MSVKITVHYEKARELALLGWETGKQVSYHDVPHLILYVDTESKYNEDNRCHWTSVTYTLEPVSTTEVVLPSLAGSIWKRWTDR